MSITRWGRRGAVALATLAMTSVFSVPAVAADPPALNAIATSGDVGILDEPSWMTGHDRGQSAHYDDGTTETDFWSFGDTGRTTAPTFVRGTVGRSPSGDIETMSDWTYDSWSTASNGQTQTVRMTNNQQWNCPDCYTWGGMIAADPMNQRMIMLYHSVGSSPDGYGVAVRDMSGGASGSFVAKNIVNRPTGAYLWDGGSYEYAQGINVKVESVGGTPTPFLYAYSCIGYGSCTLGRVNMADPTDLWDRSEWRFWSVASVSPSCGAGWSSSAGCAAPVPSATGGITSGGGGMSVHWSDGIDKYVQVYADFGSIKYRVADALEGPWSKPGLISKMKAGNAYAAYAHPQYTPAGQPNALYITYYLDDDNNGATQNDLRLVKAVLSADPAVHERSASTESYFAQDTTLRINSYGPVTYTSTTTDSTATTEPRDRWGAIYDPGVGDVSACAVVSVDSQSSGSSSASAGLVFRNSLSSIHNATNSKGWVTLIKRGSNPGGIVLRADKDGDLDLDNSATSPVPAAGVTGAVWLKLCRESTSVYRGYYSQTSSTGPWTQVGNGINTSPTTPATNQDVGIFSAGPDTSTANVATFSDYLVTT
jgi:hypothetical protein